MGEGKEVTIGYKYYMGMHMVICHSPFNPACDRVQEIIVGERSAWTGSVGSSAQIYVNSPDLFGGEKNEGGVQGYVDIMCGEITQPKNDYLVSVLGSIVPAFRNVVSIVLRQCYLTAMTPYPKAWAFKVRRIPAYDWYPAKAIINNGANGAHIIYEVLTNSSYAMGYASDAIDDASFRQVADTLHAENLSLSFALVNTDSIEAFIYTVVQHINGMFYTRPDDGRFALKLLRNNYVADNLPVYDESNIIKLESFERPSYAEMVNEVVVVYRPQGTAEDDSVTVQDLAGIAAQEGIISQTVNYPGIDTADNAARVAMRDLRQKSTPLARVKLSVLRSAWKTAIGDCINFTWSEHGVERMVLRVLGVNLGTLTGGDIVIDAVEDVFGLPNATYIGDQPSGWVDPVIAPTPSAYYKVVESSYWDLARFLTEADFNYLTTTSAFVGMVVGQPTALSINYELWSRVGAAASAYAAPGDFCPHCLSVSAITVLQTSIPCTAFKGRMSLIVAGEYAIMDNEFVKVVSVNTVTGIIVVGRGCLDTVPVAHTAGTRIFFADGETAFDIKEYTPSDTVLVRARTRTSMGLLPLADAPEQSLGFAGRFIKPYPPGNFKINGFDYPTDLSMGLVISWAHRDRTQQLVSLIDTTYGNIGPEVGTTYNVKVTRLDTNAVLHNLTGITGTSVSPAMPTGTYNVRVQLSSTRGGYNSYQEHKCEFSFLMFSGYITTEAGDIFATEDNNTFTLE